jgi:hypothetical protein
LALLVLARGQVVDVVRRDRPRPAVAGARPDDAGGSDHHDTDVVSPAKIDASFLSTSTRTFFQLNALLMSNPLCANVT